MRRYTIFARLGAGVMLIVLWGLVDSPLLGVVFLLCLLALSAIRYRIASYGVLPVLEAGLCVVYAFWWLPALLGLWLPVIGLLESRWQVLERELSEQGFADRGERLKLEATLETAAKDTKNVALLVQMNERTRIAQEIHDHVGHEISGAAIALQTVIKLHEKGDARTGELLKQCARRLHSALDHLRETVHNLKPARTAGAATLRELCESFNFCPVNFTETGDLEGFVRWDLLAANLKETLTNAARHSGATAIIVRLDGNARYIRMAVSDNGRSAGAYKPGLGLTGMKERVHAAGGTLNINDTAGFQVVCVLPKVRMNANETADC